MGIVSRLLASLTCIAPLVGCGTVKPAIYPADWPAIDAVQRCDRLDGTYANPSIADTLYPSPKPVGVKPASLGGVLSRGLPGGWRELQLLVSTVTLDTSRKTVVHHFTDGGTQTVSLAPEWECTASGAFSIAGDDEASGEQSIGVRARWKRTLLSAGDDSVVVESVAEFYGGTSFMSGRQPEVTWILFQRAADARD